MPKFILIRDSSGREQMVHIPSLASISFGGKTCFGRAILVLYYHSHKAEKYYFKTWAECEAMMNRLKIAVDEIQKALISIQLTDDTVSGTTLAISAPSQVQLTETPA
jgi:hypothetical protein